MKNKLLISFSGGRTSAYMTWYLLNEWPDRENWDMVVVFANTGKEVEGTLEFVDRCDKEWGLNVVWVEAKHEDDNGDTYSEKGWQVEHKIVSFETASRVGQPFEEMISQLGIPCSAAPFCSDQLKRKPIESYVKSIGWKKDYWKAIGIRADEIDRMNENFRSLKILYPLIKYNPVSNKMVIDWWKGQKFDLKIPKLLGNCDGCWKKSMGKLTKIANKHPKVFDWWQEMSEKYINVGGREGLASATMLNFYRGNKSPKDIFELAKLSKRQLSLFIEEEQLDGCSESCEAF